MQTNPYIVLGLERDNATSEDVQNAYNELKQKYTQEALRDGEDGYIASKKLTEIEQAYRDCMDDISGRIDITQNYDSIYESILTNIVDGRLDEAQSMLDSVATRDAEWHYLQARIYFLKDWYVECKKQLELALILDENNAKYKKTLDKLVSVMNTQNSTAWDTQSTTNNQQNTNNANSTNEQQRAGYNRPNRNTQQQRDADGCCNLCSSLICMDCCCECMGGDLIPCC